MEFFKSKLRSTKAKLYKPFRPQKRLLKHVEYRGASFVVLANEDVGWRLMTRKTYEENEIQILEELIKKKDVCLDIGGNIGIYSIFMAKKAFQGKVIAFEPIPINRNIIALNASLNEIKNIEIRDCVLSDISGSIEFSISEDSAYSSLKATNRKEEAYSFVVQSKTLDELFTKENKKVDIVKIDVEGAELLVLKGGKGLFSDINLRPRILLLELSSKNAATYGYKPESVIEHMASLGYTAYSIMNFSVKKGWPCKGCSENVLFLSEGHEDFQKKIK